MDLNIVGSTTNGGANGKRFRADELQMFLHCVNAFVRYG